MGGMALCFSPVLTGPSFALLVFLDDGHGATLISG
jgi:hypothetical protein